jgi:hypothetical protein
MQKSESIKNIVRRGNYKSHARLVKSMDAKNPKVGQRECRLRRQHTRPGRKRSV